MTIVIFGAGVQGTLYGLRLARAGHHVTLIARGRRAAELRLHGAVVRDAISGSSDTLKLDVAERISADTRADLCFVCVRREQMEEALADLKTASGIGRVVFMVNHANGSGPLFDALGRKRVVIGFPSVAGSIEEGVDVYVDVPEQPTTVETSAPDVAAVLKGAGFRVVLVDDMDSWLKRHAVFVTAVGGALYMAKGDAQILSADQSIVRAFVLGVREGWAALDRQGVASAALPLRIIFSWVPVPLAVAYWRRFFRSPKGEYYFEKHTRHALGEMAALAADVRAIVSEREVPHLQLLYRAIDLRCARAENS